MAATAAVAAVESAAPFTPVVVAVVVPLASRMSRPEQWRAASSVARAVQAAWGARRVVPVLVPVVVAVPV